MKIGIECELHSESKTILQDVAREEGLSVSNFKEIEGYPFSVMLSEEYYRTTIEYNFSILDSSECNLNAVSSYLDGQIKKFGLELYSDGPSFVGTHVHIFDEDRINMRINPLLYSICKYYISIFDEFKKLNSKSLKRLILGHQLWGNYSWRNDHIWKNIVENKGFSLYVYGDTKSKPKYNPIIYSRASERGKPKSLEIRIIPNEFIFNGKLAEMMSLIEKNKLPKGTIDDVSTFLNMLCDEYRTRSNIRYTSNNINFNKDSILAWSVGKGISNIQSKISIIEGFNNTFSFQVGHIRSTDFFRDIMGEKGTLYLGNGEIMSFLNDGFDLGAVRNSSIGDVMAFKSSENAYCYLYMKK